MPCLGSFRASFENHCLNSVNGQRVPTLDNKSSVKLNLKKQSSSMNDDELANAGVKAEVKIDLNLQENLDGLQPSFGNMI